MLYHIFHIRMLITRSHSENNKMVSCNINRTIITTTLRLHVWRTKPTFTVIFFFEHYQKELSYSVKLRDTRLSYMDIIKRIDPWYIWMKFYVDDIMIFIVIHGVIWCMICKTLKLELQTTCLRSSYFKPCHPSQTLWLYAAVSRLIIGSAKSVSSILIHQNNIWNNSDLSSM